MHTLLSCRYIKKLRYFCNAPCFVFNKAKMKFHTSPKQWYASMQCVIHCWNIKWLNWERTALFPALLYFCFHHLLGYSKTSPFYTGIDLSAKEKGNGVFKIPHRSNVLAVYISPSWDAAVKPHQCSPASTCYMLWSAYNFVLHSSQFSFPGKVITHTKGLVFCFGVFCGFLTIY